MLKSSKVQTNKRRRISFVFESPGSQKVSLVGSFNDWDENRHAMKNDGKGVWTKSVMLGAGIYEYKFVADDHWEQDPTNPRQTPNPFGTLNNVIEVQ